MKRLVLQTCLVLSVLLLAVYANAQKQECASTFTAANVAAIKRAKALSGNMRLEAAGPYLIPVQIQIVRKSDGTTTANYTNIRKELNTLNIHFSGANMIFYECNAVQYIDSDWAYNNISYADRANVANTIGQMYKKPGVLNIFYYNEIPDACGWAPYPSSSTDWIVMDNDCGVNGTTLPHEMGHFFGLYHTHEDFYGLEKVSRSTSGGCYNCATAGDLICDTPADPGLTQANVSFDGLTYIGTAKDACNTAYSPNVRNLMSYNPVKLVRNQFTQDQISTMLAVRAASRNNFNCPNPCFTAANYVGGQGNYSITRVSGSITSTVAILAGNKPTDYLAGRFIDLKRGFQVNTGAVFTGRIQPCPGSARLEDGEMQFEPTVESQGQEPIQAIHPNPITSGYLNFGRKVANYSLLNGTGQLVLQGTDSESIYIDRLGKGVYYLKLDEEVEKLVVE